MTPMRTLPRPTVLVSGLLLTLLIAGCGGGDDAQPGRNRQLNPGNAGAGNSGPPPPPNGGPPDMNDDGVVVIPTKPAVPPGCGDGKLTSDEACDDGNSDVRGWLQRGVHPSRTRVQLRQSGQGVSRDRSLRRRNRCGQ